MSPDTAWYQDETSLIEELRGQRGATPPPLIAGLSDLRELRRGGQGVVYSAKQDSTRRRVAVKLLLEHAASPMQRARFQREIDLVASFSHPHIVRIYDSGVTAEQRPYLVMEFIEGLPLHEYVNTTKPSMYRIVELFRDITAAISYAHQRGVIHRDLKPANIRISNDGQPHVLDFGLAKLLDLSQETDSLMLSISGQFFGSLPWASPEQADGRPQDVDVRSDIYAIGVMLYDALTGTMPYDVSSGIKTTLTNILEADPPRPSTLNGAINRDLETIILKALAKDPQRRYQSAQALAEDLTRYLAGDPIEARRDSALYVISKTARKHRLAVTFAVAAVAALIVFTIVLGVLYQRAVAGERLAAQRLDLAERETERAQQRFDDVRELANRFMFDVHDEIEDLAGARAAREMLVQTALQYLSSLAAEAGDDPQLLRELASAYKRVGDYQGNPYMPNLGDTEGARQSYDAALTLRQTALDVNPDDAALQREIADLLNLIGDTHLWMGDRAGALEQYNRAKAMLQQMIAVDPDNAGNQRVLAATHINTGDLLLQESDHDGMLAAYRAGLEIIERLAAADPDNHRDAMNIAVCHSKIGFAISYMGDHEAALEHLRTALQVNTRVADAQPDNATAQRGVSISANQVGASLVALQRYDEAERYYDQSLSIASALHEADKNNALAISDLAFTRNKLGELHRAQGNNAAAAEQFLHALDFRKQLTANDPANANFQRDLAISHWLVANIAEQLALDESQSIQQRAAHYRTSIEHTQHSRDVFIALRERGAIMEVDREQPESLQQSIMALQQQLDELLASEAHTSN